MEYVEKYRVPIEKELNKIELLNQLEKNTKVPKFYMLVAVSAIVLLLIVLNIGAGLLTNLVGFIYPAYASFKAIESTGTDDDTLWLTYWVVYAFCNLIEFFSDWILFWLPFYFLIKLAFLVYLFHPQYKGAVFIYKNFIRQFLVKYEKVIDKKVEEYANKASKVVDDFSQENPMIRGVVEQGVKEASKALHAD